MAHILLGYGFALMTAVLVIAGDYFIKLAADAGQSLLSVHFLCGAVLYLGSAAMWPGSLKKITLSQAGVAYSVLTLLAACLLGVVMFGEKLYPREFLGIGFACAAMFLVVRVS